MSEIKPGTIYIISDGTGETAATMIRAALVQYADQDITIVRCKNVRTESQVDVLLEEVSDRRGMIVYTVVSSTMRDHIRDEASAKGISTLDLLGPLLSGLDEYFGTGSRNPQAGLLRTTDDRYFQRIAAIEYTVKHDDGKSLAGLDQADIILVGISRTSKTPLSIFLSHKGWKVANVPLVLDSPVPEELLAVDQRKIVGLMIDIESLRKIRQNRLERLGQEHGNNYASLALIQKEIEYAHQLFKKHKRWPVFNVTERALEETATEITRLISARMGIPDPVLF